MTKIKGITNYVCLSTIGWLHGFDWTVKSAFWTMSIKCFCLHRRMISERCHHSVNSLKYNFFELVLIDCAWPIEMYMVCNFEFFYTSPCQVALYRTQ